MTETMKDEVEHIRQIAHQLLNQADNYHNLTLVHLGTLTGKTVWWLQRNVFPPPQWPSMRDAWATQRLRQAMDDLYQKATTREDFSAQRIAQVAGVPKSTLWRLMRDEWQRRLESLPTPRELVTTLVWQLVETNPPLEQFTRKRIAALSGVQGHEIGPWFAELYRTAYLTLKQRQHASQPGPPPGINGRLIAGTWIDLDGDSWDLRSAGLRVLRRDQLREDIATIVWPLLREELQTGELAPSTIACHYQAFVAASRLLEGYIPDLHLATLEEIQRAWIAYTGTTVLRRRARMGLRRIFEALLASTNQMPEAKSNELFRITGWLQDFISFRRDEPASFENRLREFAVRHQIVHNGIPIGLGSTIFRRTFTTRSLYEGQSLEALRSQLGHTTIMSTLLYSKLDLFEHPGQVRASLDLYGRHALTLWKTPLLLDELAPEERARLLKQQTARNLGVGMCRHDRCVQLDQGGPPPCSLCEHLVTGKMFLPAWHRELHAREQTLEKLKAEPAAEIQYAQLKGQLGQFKRNLAFIETNNEEGEAWDK